MLLGSDEAIAHFQDPGQVVVAMTELFLNTTMPISADKGGCRRVRSTSSGIDAQAVLPSNRSLGEMPQTVRVHALLIELVLKPGKRTRPPPVTAAKPVA